MVLDLLAEISRNLTPLGLVIALILFIRLASKAKSLNSLQAELSIFVVIWVAAELPRALLTTGMIKASPDAVMIGLLAHTLSMVAFGILIVRRFLKLTAKRR
ncbi:MAG: hypothetical protein HYU39_08180 [Thaumarchaeota archaeon]|nr:hypothetical protein [Nitrososphaerota archaeon]